jgi:hypothetical protein
MMKDFLMVFFGIVLMGISALYMHACNPISNLRRMPMLDLLYLAATAICFVVAIAYVADCDRVKAGSSHG